MHRCACLRDKGDLNPHLVFLDIEIAQVTVYICPWFRFLRKMKE